MKAGHGPRIAASITMIMILAAMPASPQQQDSKTPPPQPTSSDAIEALETGPLVIPGAAPDLVILYTGNVGGLVSPCG